MFNLNNDSYYLNFSYFSFTDTHEKASAKSFESSLQMLETVGHQPAPDTPLSP
ncbi:hypothetical protein HMPREF0658_2313 [Hoylesella marshii DSM 16973 = JCM 13450]|uniref:Uncharacterized protein n=1 Tax=Hoylesella marshii DSM 16973 = JCM 13450 TaxID=862515 RepID=E0NVV8_9BACT|nr:hypothetical protein HMPREF0658_2313 [Hoylesella marshii DSM 16973 = JCM 13450]